MSQEYDKELDIKDGVNDVSPPPDMTDDDDVVLNIDFSGYEPFRRLARDIYKGPEDGIRECLTNSFSAVLKAEGYTDLEDGLVEITIRSTTNDEEDTYLIIRDNGIGMSLEKIEKVVTKIGKTLNKDEGEWAGKWGMGFLALYMLCGIDESAAFVMHTNSRRKDCEPVSGTWVVPGEFMKNDSIQGRLEGEEFGTKFVFPLREGLSASDIKRWVYKHGEASRVPISFTWIEDGVEKESDELGGKKLEERYDDDSPCITVETEGYRATLSPSASNTMYCLDSPTDKRLPYRLRNKFNYNIDIRLLNENGLVIEGPNKGMMIAEDGGYERMSEERRENYIPRKKVDEEDIKLPEPDGSRNSYSHEQNFFPHVADRLGRRLSRKTKELVHSVKNLSDYMELSVSDRKLFKNLIADGDNLQSVYDEHDANIRETDRKIFSRLTEEMDVHNSVTNYTLDEIIRKQDSGEIDTVYMAATINQEKVGIVEEDSEDNIVIEVDSAQEYELYLPLGWKKLKFVKKNIDDLDVSQETIDQVKNNNKNQSGSINLHSKSYGSPDKYTVQELEDKLQNEDKSPPYVFLSPPASETNITDIKSLVSNLFAIANCSKSEYEELEELERVRHIDTYSSFGEEREVETSEGEMSIREMKEKTNSIYLHILTPKQYDFLSNYVRWEDIKKTAETEGLYVPIKSEKVRRIIPALTQFSQQIEYWDSSGSPYQYHQYFDSFDVSVKSDRGKNAKNIANCLFDDWNNSTELQTLKTNILGRNFNEEFMESVQSIMDFYDSDVLLSSKVNSTPDAFREIIVKTDKGKMEVSKVLSRNETPVFHVMSRENKNYMASDDFIGDIKEHLLDTKSRDEESILYIPVSNSEMDSIIQEHGKESLSESIFLYSLHKYRTTYIGKSRERITGELSLYVNSVLDNSCHRNLVTSLKNSLDDSAYHIVHTLRNAEKKDIELEIGDL